jgi:hypothetical protein
MGDTFSKVTEISEKLKLHEICMIISDNKHILRESKELKTSKYIVVATLESASHSSGN